MRFSFRSRALPSFITCVSYQAPGKASGAVRHVRRSQVDPIILSVALGKIHSKIHEHVNIDLRTKFDAFITSVTTFFLYHLTKKFVPEIDEESKLCCCSANRNGKKCDIHKNFLK